MSPDDPHYALILRWLRLPREKGARLVIAGDLFEVFLGEKPGFYERYREFWDEIQRLSSAGIHVDYIEGNHDFLLKENLGESALFQVHSESLTIPFTGGKIWVEHGDLANTLDRNYLRWRSFVRSRLARFLIRLLPESLLSAIEARMSSQTDQVEKPRPPRLLTETQREIYIQHAYKKSQEGFDSVVMGHCHDLHEAEFDLGNRKSKYFNIGYPKYHGSFLRFYPHDRMWVRLSLQNFEPVAVTP